MSGQLGPMPGLDEVAVVVTPVAERFRSAGHRIFLVGGVVRDLLLASHQGAPLAGNDIDLTTDARPDDIKELLRPLADVIWDQGERFGTIGAKVDGRAIEVTTHRAEDYDPQSRNPVVSFGDDIAGDLARRDFTVNAVAIELPGGELHDPHRGLSDLRAGLLRTPLSAEISFTDDPLRMLRAARFIPRFELSPTPDLVAAATELASRLDIVSVERVADELERLLAVEAPRAGFRFLVDTGLLVRVLPGLGRLTAEDRADAMALASATPAGPGSRPTANDVLVRRAGLLWPLRDRAGEELGRLRYSKAETARTVRLLDATGAGIEAESTPASVRRVAQSVGADGLVLVASLAINLVEVGRADRDRVRGLVEVIERLMESEDLSDLDGPLTGAEIMDLLGLEPGPEVGRAMAHLRQLRLDEGPLAVDRARAELVDWWRTRPDGT